MAQAEPRPSQNEEQRHAGSTQNGGDVAASGISSLQLPAKLEAAGQVKELIRRYSVSLDADRNRLSETQNVDSKPARLPGAKGNPAISSRTRKTSLSNFGDESRHAAGVDNCSETETAPNRAKRLPRFRSISTSEEPMRQDCYVNVAYSPTADGTNWTKNILDSSPENLINKKINNFRAPIHRQMSEASPIKWQTTTPAKVEAGARGRRSSCFVIDEMREHICTISGNVIDLENVDLKNVSAAISSANSSPRDDSSEHSDIITATIILPGKDGKDKLRLLVKKHFQTDSSLVIALQVFLPFFIAGFGTVGAGILLDTVQDWLVYAEISEMFILVPSLLGLKGNLEMTSASRLSTMVNLGQIELRKMKYIVGNISLVQVQAAVVAALAAGVAILISFAKGGHFNLQNATILLASSLATASVASIVLDSLLILVIIYSRRHRINPDNIATPLAASFGDLITLALLSAFGSAFNYCRHNGLFWLVGLFAAFFLLLLPLWIFFCKRVAYAKEVLKTGWTPVILSMLISSGSGFVLDWSAQKFKQIAAFQPVINGIGGNLVAIQSSRLSTFFHHSTLPGILSTQFPHVCVSPCRVFLGNSNIHARAARVLLAFVLPGHILFVLLIYAIKSHEITLSAAFMLFYLLAGLVQVVLLLYTCVLLTNLLWRFKVNPDNSAIPILTAMGDILGTSLLAVVFFVLFQIKDPISTAP